jgi:hypothetical protein
VREWYRATDLSRGGFFALTPKPLSAGTVLMVSFVGPRGKQIQAVAVVRDVVAGKGMGMEFCFLAPTYLETLTSWMSPSEANGQPSSDPSRPEVTSNPAPGGAAPSQPRHNSRSGPAQGNP